MTRVKTSEALPMPLPRRFVLPSSSTFTDLQRDTLRSITSVPKRRTKGFARSTSLAGEAAAVASGSDAASPRLLSVCFKRETNRYRRLKHSQFIIWGIHEQHRLKPGVVGFEIALLDAKRVLLLLPPRARRLPLVANDLHCMFECKSYG